MDFPSLQPQERSNMRKVLKIKVGTRITRMRKSNFIILPTDTFAFKVFDNKTVFSSPRSREIEKFYDQYRDAGYSVTWIRKPR